jgi:glycosyltransferase involved in cell wall biosynthesis
MDGMNALLLGGADAVVVPTRAVLDRIRLPVAEEQVFLVPTGVAARPSSPGSAAQFRRRFGIRPDDSVVLFVGRINREKGIDLLVEAFAHVRVACPQARLVLVGALYDAKWFGALVRRVGPDLADRIVLTGQQPPEVVAAAYAVADVFAFASRTDTQALVLQEAALAGLPAVLVDPVLHHCGPLGGAGVLTDATPAAFGQALARMLADPAAARELGGAAASKAAGHTPARYAAAMLAVYRYAVAARVARHTMGAPAMPDPLSTAPTAPGAKGVLVPVV